MIMATSSGGGCGQVVSFKAESDLSARQYRGVRLTAANTAGTSYISGTDILLGVLQNKPEAASSPADVQLDGITKVVTGGTCDAGAFLICGSDARFVPALTASAANSVIAVQALEAASATQAAGGGDIISARIINHIGTVS
jgi:hypothetical protein